MIDRPADAPIPAEAWDKALADFARAWAYARIERGISATAEHVAINAFKSKPLIAAWLINEFRVHEQPDVIDMRNEIEERFRSSETDHLDADVVRKKIVLALLRCIENPGTANKDVVSASKQLSRIYDIEFSPRSSSEDGGEDDVSGDVVIPLLSREEYAKMTFEQQRKLQEELRDKLKDE